MDEVLKNDIHGTFAVYVNRKTNCFAYELKDTYPQRLKELIAVFISEAEAVLKDIYGVDEEEQDEQNNVKYEVYPGYDNTFIFDNVSEAAILIGMLVKHVEDTEDAKLIRLKVIDPLEDASDD